MSVRAVALAAVVLAALGLVAGAQGGSAAPPVRVTVFGDSAATAMAYDPDAKRTLGRGIDLRLEVAACRRLGDTSCPYDGVRPPNVIDRATALGSEMGPVVVVNVGYNDFEANYADNIEQALAVFRKAGVEHVVWLTLRAERQSYLSMNAMITAAAQKHPEMTVVDWNAQARNNPAWLQPDGIHLTPLGAEGMAALVNDALVQLGVAPKPLAPPARKLLAITSRSLPLGHLGRVYAARLQAVGGTAPYRWLRSGGSIAPGVRLTTSGRLTGVPKRTGSYRLRAKVVDRAGAVRVRQVLLRIA
ncbi:hypothetical protein [Gaiella sp.]|jgi:hypothetical protein|uniref:hypothetical protein n=1 Tax=Gaiella sp. TaxID=2663207 RepID=UPI002C5B7AB5|nr:hypothetical protein [Gaiella sp.]HWO79783.1 hypothetical protein [Gaiella sp.]